jgi:hypothetical protein
MMKSTFFKAVKENLGIEMADWAAKDKIFQEIYLVDAKISRDPLIDYPENLSLEHKGSTKVLSYDTKKEISLILCNFCVSAFSSVEPDKLVMKIEASFCTSFTDISTNDESADKDLNDFEKLASDYFVHSLLINPIINAWPYWREFVQSMSARMGFPALTVPLWGIAPKKSGTKKAKRQPAKAKKEPARREKVIV